MIRLAAIQPPRAMTLLVNDLGFRLLGLTCLWSVALGPVFAEDWPRFRGDHCNGVSVESSWSHQWKDQGPPVAWSAEVGIGFSACAVAKNRLVTIGNQENRDTVFCFVADSGELLWRHFYDSPTDPNEFEGGPTSTPTIDGEIVYTISRAGDLFALDVTNGNIRWSKNLAQEHDLPVPAWGFAGSPLALSDRLILNMGDAGIAVNKMSGELIWKSEPKECGYSSPISFQVGRRTSVVFGSGRSYVSVDPITGSLNWRQRWLTTFGCNAADPVVSGHQLFLSSGYNRGSALLDVSGDAPQVVWKHKQVQNQLATSVLIDGYIYGASGDVASGASLVCMELQSGELRWQEDSLKVGALSAAGDRLLVMTDRGQLNIVQANNQAFVSLAKHQVFDAKCWTAPVLANRHVYCRSAAGHLVCLSLTSR